jgi:hypothetical protein
MVDERCAFGMLAGRPTTSTTASPVTAGRRTCESCAGTSSTESESRTRNASTRDHTSIAAAEDKDVSIGVPHLELPVAVGLMRERRLNEWLGLHALVKGVDAVDTYVGIP